MGYPRAKRCWFILRSCFALRLLGGFVQLDNVDVPDTRTRSNVKSVNQVTADRSYSEVAGSVPQDAPLPTVASNDENVIYM